MKSSRVYLSIGSNIGDRESNIAQAISALEVSEKNYNFSSTEGRYFSIWLLISVFTTLSTMFNN